MSGPPTNWLGLQYPFTFWYPTLHTQSTPLKNVLAWFEQSFSLICLKTNVRGLFVAPILWLVKVFWGLLDAGWYKLRSWLLEEDALLEFENELNPEVLDVAEKSEKPVENVDYWFDYWPEVEGNDSKELLKDWEEKELNPVNWSENPVDLVLV